MKFSIIFSDPPILDHKDTLLIFFYRFECIHELQMLKNSEYNKYQKYFFLFNL